MKLDATGIDYQQLNETIRACEDADVEITSLCGQRYIACGEKNRRFTLPTHGISLLEIVKV